MKLTKYRVTNFRSVKDSGWIDCDDVTTLVGVNESGKSNLLLALWKLKPAREGKIDILHDMPVSELSTLRDKAKEVVFIRAEFRIDKESALAISDCAKCKCEEGMNVIISRFYDGHYVVEFPEGCPEEVELDEEDEAKKVNVEDAVLKELPNFVYYSNYGNLSSKIYLPNVIKWLNKQTVQGIEMNEEQVRTLRVLFEFVKLNPTEILELGKEPKEIAIERAKNQNATITEKDIEVAEYNKEKRSILLQSASTSLTKQFKEWWKQGEYKFRFEADGNYFTIWVSDNVRTEEVGLELRSTGLQWFLSFYLIFLVESKETHKNAILLLDEAGLTLHPLAQKDLSKFFNGLSESNQIVNTTHSPFIVDTNNIDRCRVVYADRNGFTVCASDLRKGDDTLNEKSIYAVHAAMGLSVSDALLQGCQPVIVEGPSDQHYFNAIKSALIREKAIAPKQEIVFIPSGGVKGIPGIVSILGGKNEKLPFVILDSDSSGEGAKKKLESGLYAGCKERILEVGKFVDVDCAEVEDLIPFELQKRGINRLFHDVEEEYFEDIYLEGKAVVPQLEDFAMKHNISLEKGWKVEISKSVKQALASKKASEVAENYINIWKNIFKELNK